MTDISDWLTTSEAAKISGYNVEHVRRLIRAGEIDARKWGRDWMVNQISLTNYLKRVDDKGKRRGPKPS